MNGRVFVDSNVLLYAHDVDAGERHAIASQVITRLWNERLGLLSTQVLQEFYVNVTRKIPSPLPRATARTIVSTYGTWPTVVVAREDILLASEIEEQNRLSFWDALIIAAALKGHATKVVSEDFNPGQTIAGVLIENPFQR